MSRRRRHGQKLSRMPKHNLSTNAFGMSSRSLVKNVQRYNLSHRHTNLSLLQAYGPNSWKINNYILESSATRLEKAVDQLKERTVEVNRERKNAQVRMPPCSLITSPPDTAQRLALERNLPHLKHVGLSSSQMFSKSSLQMPLWRPRTSSLP
jgi:Breast carcinoma amplified sequence 2 (BCAS2)